MGKKKMKKMIKKVTKKEIKRSSKNIQKVVRVQNGMTRRITNNYITDLNNNMEDLIKITNGISCSIFQNGALTVDVRDLLLKLYKRDKKLKNSQYGEMKNLEEYIDERLDDELKGMCLALFKYFNEKIEDEFSKSGCQNVNVVNAGGIKEFEKFCEDVLHIPAELILGSDYKNKEDVNDESDNESPGRNENYKKPTKHIYDCGTKNLVRVDVVDDEMLHKLENRWYQEDPSEPLKRCHYDDCKDLIGKEIWVRSPLTCECNDGLCVICAGIAPHDENDSGNDGIGNMDIDENPENEEDSQENNNLNDEDDD